jgi:hypothetical protein
MTKRLRHLEGVESAQEFQEIMDEIRDGSFGFMEAPSQWRAGDPV